MENQFQWQCSASEIDWLLSIIPQVLAVTTYILTENIDKQKYNTSGIVDVLYLVLHLKPELARGSIMN